MRSGASVSQLLADKVVPRGARIWRALSMRVIASSSGTERGQAVELGSLDHGAAADQSGCRLLVGMEGAVLVEMRHLAAQQRAHRFERRAGPQRAVEIAA